MKLFKTICLAVIILVARSPASVRGDFITDLSVNTTSQPGGLFLYNYTLTNGPTSTLNAEGLSIGVSAAANLQAISGPNGWDVSYDPGSLLVTWESSDLSTDLLPKSSAMFTFESVLAPAQFVYITTGLDESQSISGTNTGRIASAGVASVPEPSSFSLVLSGIGTLGVLTTLARQRCKRTS